MREPDHCTSLAILGCGVVGFSWAVVFARHGLERGYSHTIPATQEKAAALASDRWKPQLDTDVIA